MLASQAPDSSARQRERLLWILAAATFIIFFQAYMVAPLIPQLSLLFGVAERQIGLMVPAYMIPYGVATLVYGLLSDRLGRRPIMLASLAGFAVLTAMTATAQGATQAILWRLCTGVVAGGVVPLALALIGRLYPYEQRGRPLGWLFGAMAGGMAFGATLGVILEEFIGWRTLFLGVAVASAAVLAALLRYRSLLGDRPPGQPPPVRAVLSGYGELLSNPRGLRTYAYVVVNGLFHSGVFTWLGVYFAQRYSLSEVGIGLALLGYGIPGFLLGPMIGRAADRFGRARLLPLGVATAAFAAAALILDLPLGITTAAVIALSLGYDMTQPLLAGIVTAVGKDRPGQAMGLNVFFLFTSFGVGSWLFGEALRMGFGPALAMFAAVQALAAVAALRLFRSERPAKPRRAPR